MHRRGRIEERFIPLYGKLREIRNHLEKLSLTQPWSLRETDLYGYQRQLDRIDEARVNGNFLDAEGKPADLHDQRVGLGNVCHVPYANLSRHCYILSDEATHTSGSYWYRPNQYPRHYYPFTISLEH